MTSRSGAGGGSTGLCIVCRHHRVVQNRRGSRFYLCELSKIDPSFRRYPALPVMSCRGFEEGDPHPVVMPEEG
jgi:hypothetical protein